MSGGDRRTDDGDEFLHEELIPALVVLGILLAFVPDPVTTALGLVLVTLGVGLWMWNLVK